MKKVRIALIIAITNFLLSTYFLLVGFRLSALFSEFNVSIDTPNPIFNKFFLGFLILAILSFAFWGYLKSRQRKGLVGNERFYSIVLLLLSGPVIYLAFQLVYSLIIIHIIIPLTI